MLNRLLIFMSLTFTLASLCLAQNANSSTQTTRRRPSTTTTTQPANANTGAAGAGTQADTTARRRRAEEVQAAGGAKDPTSRGVLAAFNALLDGIRRADVNAVTGVYWNSPQLVLFNYNGTVTRSWEQMRTNRASSYPDLKDVKLDVHDVRVQMLGRDGALLTALWTQSQTFRGTPENSSGRMTLVFRRTGGAWKAIHLHTSPDAPDPSRVPQSEQTPKPMP